jgi:hypothetical protein
VGRYSRVIAGRYCGALLRDVIAGHCIILGPGVLQDVIARRY